jgi:hypothetical protein
MSTTAEIKDSVYAKLLAKSLPRPIHTAAENARLTNMLLEWDEREDLSPEEEALAEVLTLLIEDYEQKYYPLPRVSPNDSLKALMAERETKDPLPRCCAGGGPSAKLRPDVWQNSSGCRLTSLSDG